MDGYDKPSFLVSKHLLDVIRGFAYAKRTDLLTTANLSMSNRNYDLAAAHRNSADVATQIISEIDKILTSGIIPEEEQNPS